MNRILPLLLLLAACSSPEESENQQLPEDDAGHIGDADGETTNDAEEDEDSGEPDAFDFETRCDATGPIPDGTMPALEESTAPHGPDDEERLHEHMGMIDLVSYDEVTHVAVNEGHWCNPSVWHNGEVPGADAQVVIMEDVHVRYDILSDEALFSLRVDGTLEFSSHYSSALMVDTMVVDQRGTLIVGSKDNPVQEDVSVELIFANNGDVDLAWDPQLLSRGLIAHGITSIHGHRKTTHLKVAVDPEAGDTLLELAETPQDWSVGDRIVIAGTRYSGWKWDNDVNEVRYHGTRDEVRTITAIDDTTITIDEALEFDHLSPRADLKTSIANFSRNVIFRNQSETPEELENHHRAHVMFMHSRKADVRYAQFWHLGRTDKSFATHEVDTLEEVEVDSNIRGRYSFHFHRTGLHHVDEPAVAIGNAVFQAPGWGYVHHDSNAIFDDNASFDTFGAGFVAETGNETGSWSNNIGIKAEGNSAYNPKNGIDRENFDIARTGAAFWFQGRMVRAVNNIAASVNHGFVYFHRGTGVLQFNADYFAFPEALGFDPQTRTNHPPILSFFDNESFASTVGLFVVKANPNQHHDIRSIMSDFTAWEVRAGADLEYTSHYTLLDFDLIGSTPESFRSPGTGINFGNNTSDMVINRTTIDGFETGISLGKHFTDESITADINQYVVIDAEFANLEGEEYATLDLDHDILITSADLQPDRFELAIDDWDSLVYHTDHETGRSTPLAGIKTDSIGPGAIPAGTDSVGVGFFEMIRNVEQKGYYLDADGEAWVIIEEYFADRATGEIHKVGVPVHFVDTDMLGNEYFHYADAVLIGDIDFANQAPSVSDIEVQTTLETDIIIEALANASDPEEDELQVAGITPPTYGQIFDNEDGTITYRPDFGYTGTDHFKFWTTDGQGNFSPAMVDISID